MQFHQSNCIFNVTTAELMLLSSNGLNFVAEGGTK